MALTVDTFRTNFPKFTEDEYADARVTFWLAVSVKQLPAKRWGERYEYGQGLFVAHHLALEHTATTASPAGASGMLTGKTLGGVSGSYTTQDVSLERGGNYNLTVWGREFLQLARSVVGIGGLVI